MSSKTSIIFITILSLNALVVFILFWKSIKEYEVPITIALTFTLVIITGIYVFYTKELSMSAQNQINLQLKQFHLDNRPSVFLAAWGEFQKLEKMSTIRFKLQNVGKLPARFGDIKFNIYIGDKSIDVASSDFAKPAVIFPQQDNMHIDLPVPNEIHPIIRQNQGFEFSLKLTYFSINDIKKENEFYYFVRYSLRMKDSSSGLIDEYILREVDAI